METGVSKRQLITSLASLTVIFGGIYLVFKYFGLIEVQDTIERAGIWAPLVLIAAKASTIVLAPLGGAPLYPLAGALFGFWKGTGLLLIGDALGGTIAFFLSRFFGRHLVEKLLGDDQKFLARALRMMSTAKGFLIARLCFLPLPEVVSYGAGLTRINFLLFFVIYLPLEVIPVAALASLGTLLTLGMWWVLPAALVAGSIVIPLGFLLFRSMLKEWEKTV